jgi:hypothetical protein
LIVIASEDGGPIEIKTIVEIKIKNTRNRITIGSLPGTIQLWKNITELQGKRQIKKGKITARAISLFR